MSNDDRYLDSCRDDRRVQVSASAELSFTICWVVSPVNDTPEDDDAKNLVKVSAVIKIALERGLAGELGRHPS